MKIRIFALAKELNLDSKELIDACAKIGVVLKNSALASISPEEKDKVVAYLDAQKAPPAPAPRAAPAAPTPTPTREPVKPAVAGKVRELRDVAPRPQTTRFATRDRTAGSGAAVAEAPAETEVAPEDEVVAAEPEVELEAPVEVEVEAVAETEAPAAETEPAVEIEAEAPTLEAAPAAETAVAAPLPPAAPLEAAAPAAPERPAAPRKTPSKPGPLSPMRREDYIGPGGGSRGAPPAAREPAKDPGQAGDKAARRPRPRPGPALPNLASLGTFKPPVTKPNEAPAQKPEIRLPAEILSSPRPLESILKKNAEDKDKKKKKLVGPLELTPDVDEAAGGKPGRPGVKTGGAGLSTSRRERQEGRSRRATKSLDEDDGGAFRIRMPKQKKRHHVAPLKSSAVLEAPITVRSLSEAIGKPASVLIKSLFVGRGLSVTINSSLDEETALELALEQGVDLQFKRERDIESELAASLGSGDGEGSITRPPIITILGHVDHGKTTLLDKIRSANVAAGEAGGITQHIAAYQVEHEGHKLTFVDTPGHAAFGEMRARGANVTDIVVLVVAADDGVMPQTVEAISHAKAAGVPIVVALNKCDLPGRNEQRVLQELSTHGILPAEWGGDVEIVRTSGMTGLGLDQLLETLLVTAELHELKANPGVPGHGVCLEAFRDEGRGAVAWLIVQNGTLRLGDAIICGPAYGRVRAMYNDRDELVEEAGPSTPIKIAGIDSVPGAGDKFQATTDLEAARVGAEERRERGRSKALSEKGRPRTLEDILDPSRAGAVRDLPLIVKADTPGSIEAIKHELGKFSHPEVRVKIMHDGVGGVNESDVYLGAAAEAIIVAFHVVPEERARALAEREGVEIRQYEIIYELTDHIKQALEGLLKPEIRQISTGRALVLKTFSISRFGTIAGCRVLSGTIERSSRVRLIREQRILNDYSIASLKREKDDAREVRDGMECGIRLDGFNDIKEGDLLEAFRIEEVKRTL